MMSAELICADWIVIRLIWTKGGGDQMNGRRILIAVLSIVLVAAALSGVVNTVESHPMPAQRAELANVRDYAAAQLPGGTNYAVDGGVLFKGQQDDWIQVAAPRDVVTSLSVPLRLILRTQTRSSSVPPMKWPSSAPPMVEPTG
jgi:hypothetical protein